MLTIRNKYGIETHIFASIFEHEALEQVKKLSNYEPYAKSKIRIMPDAHAGKGCTIGTTMTIHDKVTPNLVGVDIGCGMLTVALDTDAINYEKLDRIIKTKIPYGFDVHKEPVRDFDLSSLRCRDQVDVSRAALSVGSLGGGNHFIEVARSEKSGNLFLIIHSGSRKLGGDVCMFYQDKAIKNAFAGNQYVQDTIRRLKAEGKKKEIQQALKKLKIPEQDKDLAYLEGDDFDNYMHDMAMVQRYAATNRETMANIILREMEIKELSRFQTIHNYIDFNRKILRKGAVSAEKDEILLIPINMRDGSLLCKGKGNENWNYSAPHGAGRLMSRNKAKEILSMEAFSDAMKDVFTTSVVRSTLDEAPQAYKPIESIVNSIADTVDIEDALKPTYNFKAH